MGIWNKIFSRGVNLPSGNDDENTTNIDNIELGVAAVLYGFAGMMYNGPRINIGSNVKGGISLLNRSLNPKNNIFHIMSGNISKICESIQKDNVNKSHVSNAINSNKANGSLSDIVNVLNKNNTILSNNISTPLSTMLDTMIEIRNIIAGTQSAPEVVANNSNTRKVSVETPKKETIVSGLNELINSMYLLTEINPSYQNVIIDNLLFLRDVLLDDYIDIITKLYNASETFKSKKSDINVFINSITLIINSVKPLASFAIVGMGAIVGTRMLATVVGMIDRLILTNFTNEKLRFYKTVLPALMTFAEAMTICAGTLLIGAIVWKYVTLRDIVGFVVTMALLVTGATYAYSKIANLMKDTKVFSISADFNKLIFILAGTMILTGFALKFISMNGMATFMGILGLMAVGIAEVLGKLSEVIDGDALSISGDFSKIIIALTGALIIGGLFMMIPNMPDNVLIFGGLLSGFIVVICGAFAFLGKHMRRVAADAKKFAMLVAITAATLVIGGLLMYIPGMKENIMLFATVLGIFIIAFSTAMLILTKNAETFAKALPALFSLTLITVAAAGMLYVIGKVTKETETGDLVATAVIMCTTVFTFALLAMMMGAAGPEIILGVATIAAIVGTIYLFANVMKTIAETMKIVNDIGSIDTRNVTSVVKGFITMAKELLLGSLVVVPAATMTIPAMLVANTISKIARAVSNIANLTIAEYDENGNVKSKRQMTPEDFTRAGLNVAILTTFLARALVNGVKDSDAFNDGLFEKSPAENAAIAIGKVSDVMMGLANGVREFSTIDFNNNALSQNIQKIITAIPKGLVDGINSHPEYFKYGVYGSSIMTTVSVIKELSGELTTLAQAVGLYARGKFPIYELDENGRLVHTGEYVDMTTDVINHAKTRIQSVISAIADAISGVSFRSHFMFSGGDASSGATIARSISGVGAGIIEIFKAVNEIGNKNFTKESLETLYTNTKEVIEEMINFAMLFTSDRNGIKTNSVWGDKLSPAEFFNRYSGQIYDSIDNIKNIFSETRITDMFDSFANVSNAYIKSKESIDKIIAVDTGDIAKFMMRMTEIVQRFTKGNALYNAFDSMNKNNTTISIGLTNVSNAMNRLKGIIGVMSDINKELNDTSKNTVGNITQAIYDINKAIVAGMNMQAQYTFDEQSKSLERYVNSINGINIAHVDRFTDLIDSLNQLGINLGGIDKLAEALSANLSTVLDRLVEEMKHASDTITAADKIQSQRQTIIKESIEKIKAIMSEKITVEITQPEQEARQSLFGGGLSLFGGDNGSVQPNAPAAAPNGGVEEDLQHNVQTEPAGDSADSFINTKVADGSSQRPYYVIISQTN